MRKALFFLLKIASFPFGFFYRKRIRVLAYHTVPDEYLFEKQVRYLKKKYNLISINDLYEYLFNKKNLPVNSVLVTFDDGDVSVLEKGLPVLTKHDVPSVLFIIADLIDSNDNFWWRSVEINFKDEGKSYSEARKKVRELKEVANSRRIEYLSDLKETRGRQLMSSQLLKLSESKMFIANHTFSHPMINFCTGNEVRQELRLTKEKFEEWRLINGYSVFAYPNGNRDERSEEILKEEGIKMAFLFDHKINNSEIEPLRISRIAVDADLEMNEFKAKISGIHPLLFHFFKSKNSSEKND